MRAVELTGAVTDPQHVRGAVVPAAAEAVLADESLLVVQQQCLVSREKAGLAQLWRAIQAACAHEFKRFVDACAELVVLLGQQGVGDEVQVPLMHLVQVGETALGECA